MYYVLTSPLPYDHVLELVGHLGRRGVQVLGVALPHQARLRLRLVLVLSHLHRRPPCHDHLLVVGHHGGGDGGDAPRSVQRRGRRAAT